MPGWLFRIGSRPERGGGHLARGGRLAKAMAGHVAVCVCLDREGLNAARLFDGFPVSVISEERLDPEAIWDGVVLDCYDVSDGQTRGWARRTQQLAVFADDLRPPAGSTLLINSAPHTSGEQFSDLPALLGPQYAIVDPGFVAIPDIDVDGAIRHILLSFGWRDSVNATGLALSALTQVWRELSAPKITVVLAEDAPNRKAVEQQLARAPFADVCRLLPAQDNLAPLVSQADLVIGAGGVSLLERMAAGRPSASVAQVESQLAFLRGAAQAGGTEFVGLAQDLPSERFAERLLHLAMSPAMRARMARRGRELVDGRGIDRIISKLLSAGKCRYGDI